VSVSLDAAPRDRDRRRPKGWHASAIPGILRDAGGWSARGSERALFVGDSGLAAKVSPLTSGDPLIPFGCNTLALAGG